MELSKEYLYGCLFFANKIFIYINKDKAFYGTNDNDFQECDPNQYMEIKHIFEERIEYIYNSKKVPKTGLNLKINLKKRRLNNGGNQTYESVFSLPQKSERMSDFFKTMQEIERGYLSSTRDANKVNAIALCFFHIDNFNMSQFGIDADENAYIISEQTTIDKTNYEKTIQDIRSGTKIYPVYMDVEYLYDSKQNSLQRQYYLSDGNHRIMALKNEGYSGMVPVIVCDYLENILN